MLKITSTTMKSYLEFVISSQEETSTGSRTVVTRDTLRVHLLSSPLLEALIDEVFQRTIKRTITFLRRGTTGKT